MNRDLAVAWWNAVIALRAPDVAGVPSALGGGELVPVFANPCDFQYAGNDFVMRLRPGSRLAEDATVLSVMIVLSASFFSEAARVTTEDVPQMTLLGARIPCSAQRMLDHVRALAAAGITLSAEPDRCRSQEVRPRSVRFGT